MTRLSFLLTFILIAVSFSYAQQPVQQPILRARRNTVIVQQGEQLTLQQAIAMALDKNYQIRIARTQQQVTQNDFTIGNAGFLPLVNGTLNNNNTLQNLRQEFLDGVRPKQEIYGVNNRSTNVGVSVNWPIFNGFSTFYAYDQLRELVRISEVTTRTNIESTVANVSIAYYDVIRQLQQLLSLRQALDISRERLELARANYEVGTRSRVDFLSAQVDYNTDSSAMVTQQQNVRNAKTLLNSLVVRDPATEFAVRDTILVRTDLAIEPLRQSMNANNPQLVAAALNRRVADLNIRLAQAQRLPTVNLVGGYTFNAVDNQAGFGVARARNDVLNYGIQASVPIFNGFNQRRLVANAKANALISEYQEADLRLQIQQALEQTYSQYRNSLTLVNLEFENFKIANQNVEIAFERYRVGNSTAVEFRDVQRNAVAAETRLSDAEYNTKVAEIELLRLTSTILQELK